MDSMLSLYRRHTKKCAHRRKGSLYLKCGCPVWCWGALPSGRFIRRSVSTRNMSVARRTVEVWERETNPDKPPSLAAATELFLAHHADSSQATRTKYGKIMRLFREFSERWGYEQLAQITVETFDRYRETRDVAPLTWSKELQVLRSFCEFAVRREWMNRNIAREAEMPRGIKSADREPYTEAEMVAMLQACDVIGQRPYERLRARAMVLVMRYAGLSMRNTFLLRRDQVKDGYLEVRRAKNGKRVKVPVTLDLMAALNAVPVPRTSDDPTCPYFFYHGRGEIDIEYAQRSAEAFHGRVLVRLPAGPGVVLTVVEEQDEAKARGIGALIRGLEWYRDCLVEADQTKEQKKAAAKTGTAFAEWAAHGMEEETGVVQ